MPHAISTFADEPAQSALVRIQRLSKPFSILFTALAAIMICLSLVMVAAPLIYDGPHIRVTADLLETGQGQFHFMPDLSRDAAAMTIPISELPLRVRILAVVNLGLLQWGSLALIFFYCRNLFRLYEQGEVFAPENIACLRHLALWLVIWGVAPAIGHQIATLSGVLDVGWLRASSLGAIVLGGFLFILAKVIDLGREIETDRARYI